MQIFSSASVSQSPTKYVFINIVEDLEIQVFLDATQGCGMKHVTGTVHVR
jgi:hypothetical protein